MKRKCTEKTSKQILRNKTMKRKDWFDNSLVHLLNSVI